MTGTLKVFLVLGIIGAVTRSAPAQRSFFVSTQGSDGNSGTASEPFATIGHAIALTAPGDTVFVGGGVYSMSSTLRIDKSGRPDSILSVFAVPGTTPVLDFDGVSGEGIDLRGSNVHLRGLTVENAADNGIFVKRASNNLLEMMTARYNGNSGVQVEDGSSDNLILNTDSYGNYDPENHGENADGFAIKFDVGAGNVLRGCRAFDNSDDGFDFWEAGSGVTVEASWSFHNGHNIWSDPDFEGDSNGFKLGHGAGAHLLIRNLAWDHLKHGFDVNGNETGVTVYNNTAFRNADRNFYFDEENSAHVLRNNVSLGGQVEMFDAIDDSLNSWNGFNIGGADFLSLTDAGRDSERGADGSLPWLSFLRPAAGSAVIDAGMDVGIAFEGSAPDLGAYEYEDVATSVSDEQPESQRLSIVAYPNPFSLESTIVLGGLSGAGSVTANVFDVTGRLVDRLSIAGAVGEMDRRITWRPGRALAGGVYLVRVESDLGALLTSPLVYITD